MYARKTPFFSVFATQSDNQQARLGIVVAKRYVKLAVARNKLKRLIRETFRQKQYQLSGLDVVVVVKKNFEALADERQRLPTLLSGLGVKHAKCYKE